MSRWLEPRSTSGRIAVEVLLLLAGAGAVYLIVTWLGGGLGSGGL